MYNKITTIFLFSISLWAIDLQDVQIDTVDVDFYQKTDTTKTDKKDNKKKKEKTFEEQIKDMQPIKGLFTIYFNVEKNSALLEITPDQLNKVYLCNMTRQSGDGMMFDAGSMLGEFPFYFQKIGERIQMIQKNISFRAENDLAVERAVEQSFSNSIFGSAKIISKPHPETKAVLIKIDEILFTSS